MAQKKTAHGAPWTKEDVRELRAHSKARTPLPEIAKKMKRTERALRRKAEFSASAWDIAADSPPLQERRGPMRWGYRKVSAFMSIGIKLLDARELHRIERHRSTRPPRGHLSNESFLQLIADLESDSTRVFTSAFESVKNQIDRPYLSQRFSVPTSWAIALGVDVRVNQRSRR